MSRRLLVVINGSTHTQCYNSLKDTTLDVQHIHHTELAAGTPDQHLANITHLLITGGPQHIPELSDYPELYYELELIRTAIARGITIIGICLGFQLINHYFGNQVIHLPTVHCGTHYLDISTVNPHTHPNLDWPLLKRAVSFHFDGVPANTSSDLLTLAYSTTGLVYVIKHRTLPIYGFQSHPEAQYDKLHKCFRRFGVDPATIELESPETYTAIRTMFFDALLV